MYRKRRIARSRRRRATAVAAFAAALVVSIGIPTLALGDPVKGLIDNMGVSGSGGSGSGGGASPNAGVPPTYEPPLHGTNPHGEGSNVILDLQPGETNPYADDPSESGEEVVVGQADGQEDENGAYSGEVTLLWLFGNPIVQITTDETEQDADGPLQPLQDGLDQLCSESDNQICLSVLEMHSHTDNDGSENSLTTLGVDLGAPDEEGARPLSVHAVEANGNINESGGCQTAHGDSSVLDANVGPLTVDALQGSSTSNGCGGAVENDSTFLNIGGENIPFPEGCGETTNASFVDLAPLLALVCAADDTNGSQTSAPYGVREALALFALISGDTAVIKVAGGAAESHARTSDGTTPPNGGGPTDGGGTQGAGGKGGGAGGQGAGGDGDGGAGAGAGGGGAAGDAAAGDGSLAFTGADLLVLGLVGGALILGGLALTTMAGRRHRQTV